MSIETTFLPEAQALLGARGFSTDMEIMAPWLTDWRGRYSGRAVALASPASTEEVSALVRLCARHAVPIVPQGGNSGMSGGATPDASGTALLLSLRRMGAIRQLDVESRQVTCDAGVVLQTLHDAVGAHGLRFPLTLGGKGSATVGGLVSTNAGGTQVLRHGSMRAQILGLEAVLADGTIFSALTPLRKDNRGFDLKQLLIGSEGTLGIVTAATLRLLPAIAARTVIWAGVDSLQSARAFLLHCEDAAGNALEGFEVLPGKCLDTVVGHLPGARAPLADEHAWHVLVEIVASAGEADGLRDRAETMLATAFERGLVHDATIAASEAQAEAFWLLRDSISAAERAHGPAVQHDISIAVERMPDFVDYAVKTIERDWPGVAAIAYGHLGDGNVHFHVRSPSGADRSDWESGDGKAITRQVHELVTEWDGSISAEHGIGQLKRDELVRLADPAQIAIMQAIKAALDPAGLLNPGKLVPLAQLKASA